MGTWSPAMEPPKGSPDDIRALAGRWLAQSSLQQNSTDQLNGTHAQLHGVWRESVGADAFGAQLLAPGRSLTATSGILQSCAYTLLNYADQLEDYQTQAANLQSVADGASARILADANTMASQTPSLLSGNLLSAAATIKTAKTDSTSAADLLASTRAQSQVVTQNAYQASLLAAQTISQGRDSLAGWQNGSNFGSSGIPAQGTMVGSAAYANYLDEFAQDHPPTMPKDPKAAAAYWQSLGPDLRAKYIQNYPALVGNTNGIPAADRDQANRINLAATVAAARARTAAVGSPLPSPEVDPSAEQDIIARSLKDAGYSDEEVKAISGALAVDYQLRHGVQTKPGVPIPTVQLVTFDPSAFGGRGRAAISIGDLATAKNVAVLVPGMTSQVPTYMGTQMSDANNLYNSAAASDSTAVVAYIGYNAPDMSDDAASQTDAENGAPILAADLAGFAAMQTGPKARTTVVAHSYGSTTAAIAFNKYGAKADALVMIGSPGAGTARTAADLNMPPGSVFVGAASGDPVTTIVQQAEDPSGRWMVLPNAADRYLGPDDGAAVSVLQIPLMLALAKKNLSLGVDPAGKNFGAIRFHAEAPNKNHYDFDNHSDYYADGSESLNNITKIVDGQTNQVTVAQPRQESGDHYSGSDPELTHQPGQ